MTLLESLGSDPHSLRGALADCLEQSRLWAIAGNERLRAEYAAKAAEIAERLGEVEMTPVAGEEDPMLPVPIEPGSIGYVAKDALRVAREMGCGWC